MQSWNRIMSGICSSRRAVQAQGKWRSLSPWIEYLRGHGMTVLSRKMRTTVPGCTSFGGTAIRCPASQRSPAKYISDFRFSHLTLLSIKNYEYFCVQNYKLDLRLLHNDADYGSERCTFPCWHRKIQANHDS